MKHELGKGTKRKFWLDLNRKERLRHRWEVDIKGFHREVRCKDVDAFICPRIRSRNQLLKKSFGFHNNAVIVRFEVLTAEARNVAIF
jgi:hypothetical protein